MYEKHTGAKPRYTLKVGRALMPNDEDYFLKAFVAFFTNISS